MTISIQINGVSVAVPEGAVAYKYTDPTEDACWLYDEAAVVEIEHEDRSLVVRVPASE